MRTEAAAKGDKGCGCRLRKEHEETSRDHGNTVTGIQAYIHEAQGEREVQSSHLGVHSPNAHDDRLGWVNTESPRFSPGSPRGY